LRGSAVIASQREALVKELSEMPDSYKGKVLKDFDRMQFDTEEAFNDYLNETKTDVATFKKLNTDYYKKNIRVEVSRLGTVSFDEKDISFAEDKIVFESSRCFSCGNCFHCDNCYGYCPDNAIKKAADGSLEINYDYCKGCGICATECPCGAIKMTS
jgi:2-oxoacid:acceptor oxidoreductase delta subunit (pyruvate/2-ketoisovalerate family)